MANRKARGGGQLRSIATVVTTGVLITLPFIDPGKLVQRPLLPAAITGELVVVSRSAPTTRFIGPDGTYSGFEQDMLELFAQETNLRLSVVESRRFSEIIPTVSERVAHLAAAGLSVTEEREEQINFGPKYMTALTHGVRARWRTWSANAVASCVVPAVPQPCAARQRISRV